MTKPNTMIISKFITRNAARAAFLLVGLIAGQGVLAQDQSVGDGVFTQAQVDAGQSVYDSTCKACHDMRFYRDILRSWTGQPLLYLWENILGTMPADNPGSLGYDEYTNVLAYILAEQGFPAGEATLDPDNGMDAIKIAAPE